MESWTISLLISPAEQHSELVYVLILFQFIEHLLSNPRGSSGTYLSKSVTLMFI